MNDYLEMHELYHSFLGSTWKKIKHKYVAKIKTAKNKFRYFYSKQEYEAYLNKKNKKKVTGVGLKLAITVAQIGLRFISSVLQEAEKKEYEQKEAEIRWRENKKKAKEFVAEKQHRYLFKVTFSNGESRYFYTEEEYLAWKKRSAEAEHYQKHEPTFLMNVKECDPGLLPEEHMYEINEKYHRGAEYQNNCADCSMAYEMRRRGYDVEAIKNTNGETADEVIHAFNDPPIRRSNSARSVMREMEKNYSPGDRGIIMVSWKGGGGHAMNWEILENGECVIRDCQVNTTYTKSAFDRDMANHIYTPMGAAEAFKEPDGTSGNIIYFRTDNADVNQEILMYVEDNKA